MRLARPGLVADTGRATLLAAAAVAPALATMILVQIVLGAGLSDFVPSAWNDQTTYWHEIFSFARVGFASGYYAPNEHVAAIGLLHFDVGSPLFVIGYGAIASVVGWGLDSSIYFNFVMVGSGIVAFCLAAKLDRRQVAAVGLVCLAFGPILLYLPRVRRRLSTRPSRWSSPRSLTSDHP